MKYTTTPIFGLIQITKNHLNVSKEHIKNHKISHTPNIIEALRITLYDFIFNKTIYIHKYKAHLIYERQVMPTLGLRNANVIRIYVPPEHRGKGIASLLYDAIPEKQVIGGASRDGRAINYPNLGSIYLIRS